MKIIHNTSIKIFVFTLALFYACSLISVDYAFAGSAIDQVRETVDKVIEILKDKELKKPQKSKERRTLIRKTISERFDFDEMARRSLGLHWKGRTQEEKKEFIPLYADLLERSYINKIESYTDEKVFYLNEKIDNEYAVVDTKIVTKRKVEVPIEYRLLKKNSKWEVYDVVIEGVSLVNNYRTQFNKIIRTDSYEELVKRMKTKQEEESGGDLK